MIRLGRKSAKSIRQTAALIIVIAIAVIQLFWNPVIVKGQIDSDNIKSYALVDSSNGIYSFKNNPHDIEFEIKPSGESRINSSLAVYKWEKNAGFEIILPAQTNLNEITDEGEIVGLRLLDANIENRFYLKSSSEFEWEIILSEKPESNILKYDIVSDNLRFYYQHPDTFEAHRHDWDFNDNIPGSYAAFYSPGKHNQYKAGKAFHIYRPRAWNNTGDTVWCDLAINASTKTLTISIPQVFLDSTGYPVVIDPTFGCTSKGGTAMSMGANNFRHLVNYNDYADADGSLLTAYICGYKNSESAACTTSIVVYSYSNNLNECQKIATSNKIEVTKFAIIPDSAVWHNAPISGTLEDDEEYVVSWQGYETCDYCLRVCADYTGIWGYERYADYSNWGTSDNLSGYYSDGYIYSVYVEYDEGGSPSDSPYIRTRKLKRSH